MVGVAVIGAGNWGKNLVRNFASIKDAQLKYVVDLNEKTRASMAASYPKATITADLATVLADASVDACVVAVDAPYHFDIAKKCLEAGKHCYVEKPLTLVSSDAKTLETKVRGFST